MTFSIRYILLLTTVWLASLSLPAQPKAKPLSKSTISYNEALQSYREGDAKKSAAMLQQLIKTDPGFYLAYFALADIYHADNRFDEEVAMLTDGLQVSGDQYPNGYKFLSELLYRKGDYATAKLSFDNYNRLKTNLTVEEQALKACYAFAAKAADHPVAFRPVNPGTAINSANDEYWPSLNGEANRLVFTRLVKADSLGRTIAQPQEDFWISVCDSANWQTAVLLGPPVNSDDNEGAQSLSADGRLLFFTACNRSDGLGSCDIYMSVNQKGTWSEPVNLGEPVNSKSWESQPAISADGRFLYFVSSRAGGKGKMDIWRAEKLGVTPEGLPVYGKVTNVEVVNTSGNDFSPFIHADGRSLYFASDGWPGMGGADLFKTEITGATTDSVLNLGFPINTHGHEEGLVVEVSGSKAWYTADNEMTQGRDILFFNLPEMVQPGKVAYVKGRVVDAQNKALLKPDLLLNNLNDQLPVRHIYPFENDGEFLFCLPAGKLYGLSISQPGYLFRSFHFDLQDIHSVNDPLTLEIGLEKIELNKSTVLSNIFFATDSWQLKPESDLQLAEIVAFMQQNPTLKIEIGGHTDLTGSEAHNITLSEKRAEAVVVRLKESGIDSSRMVSRGYGYSQPAGDNRTEQGRAQNRRTEMKVVQLSAEK